MLDLRNLTLTQGDFRLTAHITLPASGILAVMGPSGAGKSTLLAAIAGFLAPTEGQVLWQGREITPLAPGDRPVSMLFQDQNLFPHLTVAQNAGLALAPRLRLAPADQAKVAAILDRLGIGDLAARRPGDLSGGQAARAALARVLLADRPVILMDEPFAALGPALRADMLGLVKETCAGRLVIMVTHHPQDARDIADQLVIVADGQATGPQPLAALDDPKGPLAGYLAPGTVAAAPGT
jgi:thiamine transport system ATP-binding protein